MIYIYIVIASFVAGFITGFLVFHNNETKANAIVSTAQATAKTVETAASTVASEVKKA